MYVNLLCFVIKKIIFCIYNDFFLVNVVLLKCTQLKTCGVVWPSGQRFQLLLYHFDLSFSSLMAHKVGANFRDIWQTDDSHHPQDSILQFLGFQLILWLEASPVKLVPTYTWL